MAKVDDFLKPESMMTPGVAGAITMTISNTLWVQFGLQQRWCALGLSFAFGALVFAASRLPVWQRGIYYVLNSLIIFSAAAGHDARPELALPNPGSLRGRTNIAHASGPGSHRTERDFATGGHE